MAVFRVVSCSLVEVYRYFSGVSCLHHQGDDWGAVRRACKCCSVCQCFCVPLWCQTSWYSVRGRLIRPKNLTSVEYEIVYVMLQTLVARNFLPKWLLASQEELLHGVNYVYTLLDETFLDKAWLSWPTSAMFYILSRWEEVNPPLIALCLSGVDSRLCSSEDVCIIVRARQPRCVQNLLNTKCNLSTFCETTTNSVLNEQDVTASLCLQTVILRPHVQSYRSVNNFSSFLFLYFFLSLSLTFSSLCYLSL
jgi:hypothetical protein